LNTVEYANLCYLDKRKAPTLGTWHRRLGHLNPGAVKLLLDKGLATGNGYSGRDFDECIGCVLGKQHRESFPKKSERRAKDVLEIVHTDVFGATRGFAGKIAVFRYIY
jgi:hypothetical protein